MKITTVGIDLAKNVIQVHGVDERGKAVLRKAFKRDQLLPCFANLPSCLIGMEACGSAHYWAKKLQALGHTVRLMAPQFVKPYVKSNKNDARDAEAICEAVSRPSMRFVPIKHGDQQAVLSLHRARQGFIKARTAQANQIRGLLAEYGLVIAQGIGHIAERLPEILEDGSNELPGIFRQLMHRLGEHLGELDRQVKELESRIQAWHRESTASRKLADIPGIGWRHLPANIADSRCQGGGAYCREQNRSRHLAWQTAGAAQQERRSGSAGQQERPDCLGLAGTQRSVPSRPHDGLCRRVAATVRSTSEWSS